MGATAALGEILTTLFERRPFRRRTSDGRSLKELCAALLSDAAEPSSLHCADAILDRYGALDDAGRAEFFGYLDSDLDIDAAGLVARARDYAAEPTAAHYAALAEAAEPPRRRLFRRLNAPPGATVQLVRMRADLLRLLPERPELARTDLDLAELLRSWFNRGFLVLRRITWDSPASILEKIIAYEAVHQITSWEDLRRRLDPADRRLFAFFHPAMPSEPLIFVEVALTRGVPGSIDALLAAGGEGGGSAADTAVFYAISNCQAGLRGISFGNSLIKQVVRELSQELPELKNFVTLSPIPGLRRWMQGTELEPLALNDLQARRRLAAYYLVNGRDGQGRPLDPVARFHLGNGAYIGDVHLDADLSPAGQEQSLGVMVNYHYDPARIAPNLLAFAENGEVAAASAVRALARQAPVPRGGGEG